MADVKQMVPWSSETAVALAQQLQERVANAREDGKDVAVAMVLITGDESGRTYEAAFSTMPVEVALWAAEKLREKAWTI